MANGEYQFCDEDGQRYVGVIVRRPGFFSFREGFELRPEGSLDLRHVLALIDRAVEIEPNDRFPNRRL